MTIRRESVDQRCYDLAEDWIQNDENADLVLMLKPDHRERVIMALAGDIQGAVEDFDFRNEIREAAAKKEKRLSNVQR